MALFQKQLSSKAILICLLIFAFPSTHGQSDNTPNKTVKTDNINYSINSLTLSYGQLYLKDSYLSELPYLGWNITLEGTHKGFFNQTLPLLWKVQNTFGYGNSINLPATASMGFISGETGFGLGYSFSKENLGIELGGISSFLLTNKYSSRNINNFQSLDIAINNYIDMSLSYKLSFKKVSLKISDNIQVPIIGSMFVPEYGALYYEYYLGDKNNMLHFSSLHNKIGVKNRLEFSIAIKRIIFNILYIVNYQKWNANNLFFSQLQHNIGIGIILHLQNITDK